MGLRRVALPAAVLRDIRLLKEAPAEFQLQHTGRRLVDPGRGDQPPLHRLLQMPEGRVPQPQVHTGSQRQRAGGRPVSGHRVQLVDGYAVAHDDAGEAVLLPQQVPQQPGVCVAVHAVDLVVGRHKGGGSRLHAGTHGGQVDLPQLPGANPGRAGVDAARGLPLGAQMLGGHVYLLAPVSPDYRSREGRGQHRVLSEALLTAAPPGIPEDVQGGDQGQIHPHGPQLPGADLCRLLQQRRGPGGRRGQVHRQQAAVQSLMAVGTFGGHQRRDAQAGVFHQIPLDHVPGAGSQRPVQSRIEVPSGPWVRPVQAVQRADAAVPVRLPVKLLRQPDIPALPLIAGEAVQPLGQLSRLLPQGHAAQQVRRPLLRREMDVSICFHCAPPNR